MKIVITLPRRVARGEAFRGKTEINFSNLMYGFRYVAANETNGKSKRAHSVAMKLS